jgi:DNA-binding winged helix-turn-helix (wHTH) protein
VKATPQSNGTSAEVSRPTDTAYTFGAFRLVPKERKLLLADQPMQLGSRAFEILVVLVERAGMVVPADELMRLVWPGIVVDEANLRVQLGSLRKVLARGEGGRSAIETVPLRGYCFVLPVVHSKARPAASEQTDVDHNLPLR